MGKGTVFNIQRFSLHDGPGIRTTIFFKGCPLNCWWCQNPEGINPEPDLMRRPDRCLGCGSCQEVCPEGAVRYGQAGPVINRELCTHCLKCTATCPVKALEAVGQEYAVSELVREALKDRFVFDSSGGGVTLSGGEPLMQPDFLEESLIALHREGVHTAVDTTGYAPWPILEKISDYTDLFLYDLKLVNELESEKYTGLSSRLSVENLKKLVGKGALIKIRMPVIPLITDDSANIDSIADLLDECGLNELELIPYHNYGTAKYAGLDLEYRPGILDVPTAGQMDRIKARFEKRGIKISSEDDRHE